MQKIWGLFFCIGTLVATPSFENVCENQSQKEAEWVDGTYQKLSEEERIGQLFVVRMKSDGDAENEQAVEYFIKHLGVGGVVCFRGKAEDHVRLVNKYQRLSKIPLLVTIDGEWGVNMRLYDVLPFPRQRELGKIKDNALIYDFGKEVARQCKRVGVHINFAPVADVDSNPNNPIIATRSFGADKKKVIEKCLAYIQGMQDSGVLGCIKHFPGHGDTTKDSHHTLPVIVHDRTHLDEIELYPFKYLIKMSGVAAVMVAHLHVPALDGTQDLPTSLSHRVVTDLLQHEFGFKGLIFTDGLKMAGVRGSFGGEGEVEVQAFIAGNDIALGTPDELVEMAHSAVKNALREGRFSKQALEHKVKKVLRVKYRLGLSQGASLVQEEGVLQDLNSVEAQKLQAHLKQMS